MTGANGSPWPTPLINGDTPFRLVFGLDPRMDFMEIDASGVVDPNVQDGARSLEERRDRLVRHSRRHGNIISLMIDSIGPRRSQKEVSSGSTSGT